MSSVTLSYLCHNCLKHFMPTADCTTFTLCSVCNGLKPPPDRTVVRKPGIENLAAAVNEARRAAPSRESIPCYDCQTYFQPEHDVRDIRCTVCEEKYVKETSASRGEAPAHVRRKQGVEDLEAALREGKLKKE